MIFGNLPPPEKEIPDICPREIGIYPCIIGIYFPCNLLLRETFHLKFYILAITEIGIMSFDGIDPHDWENIAYAGLTHLNTYAKDKLLHEHPNGLPFVALASYWAECLSPAIPDGR